MHAGAVAPGMNASVRAFTRLAINHGHTGNLHKVKNLLISACNYEWI